MRETGSEDARKTVLRRRVEETVVWMGVLGFVAVILSIQEGWTFYARNPLAIGLAVLVGILGAGAVVLWEKATPALRRLAKLGVLGLAAILLPLVLVDFIRISIGFVELAVSLPPDEGAMSYLLYVPAAMALLCVAVTAGIWVAFWRILRQRDGAVRGRVNDRGR